MMFKPKERIRVTMPSITKTEIDLVTKAVTDGWGANAFSYIKRFEKEFASYVGVPHAIATSSCTGALHIALKALDVGPDDEVILPDMTWAATAFAISYVGATPVFADILPDTWCVDPKDIEHKITKKTKAIIPVHLYGHPADMDSISAIAKNHNIAVVEDAAESIGASYHDKKTGSMGDFATFSFHGTKTLTTGEGGMLTTGDKDLFEKANFLANQAKSPDKIFWNTGIGLKYKMSDIQAALGLAQLSRIDELIAKKRQIFRWYKDFLGKRKELSLNAEKSGCVNTFWMPTVVWEKSVGLQKEDVMKQLSDYNIDPRPIFYPLTSMPPYKRKVDNPVSYDISTRGINVPCSHNLTRKEAHYVSEVLLKILSL